MNFYFNYKDDENAAVIWTKRGHKFSSRASGSPTDYLNTALLSIKNFQEDDLGVYICKAKNIESSRSNYMIKGERNYYLMASEFGVKSNNQLLLGPDLSIKAYCDDELNVKCPVSVKREQNLNIKCSVSNFDTSYEELKVKKLEWIQPGQSDAYVEQIDPHETTLKISNLNKNHAGKYYCYVYASTGTIKQSIEIVPESDEFKIVYQKPTKRINLSIEKLSGDSDDDLSDEIDYSELQSGKYYQFNCITG